MFSHPLDQRYPATSYFSEKDRRHTWSIDPDNGLWIPVKDNDGLGHHCGVDFACPPGTIVRAMADGIVTRARFESALDPSVGAGLYLMQLVSLLGYDSWTLRYTHLRAVYVEPGQRIVAGEAIAESGNTGAVQSPYLHVDLMNLKWQWKPIPLKT